MSEQNVSIARRLIEGVWNNRDLALIDQLIAPDFRNIDPATPDLGAGPEGFRRNFTLYTTAFPNAHFVIDEVVDGGDKVVLRWTVTGSHSGDLQGIKPTNKNIRVSGVSICRIANGKIAETNVVWDALGLMQQIGVVAKTEKIGRAA
jgi:steroid delta-isomerase-like uncharacterized protein